MISEIPARFQINAMREREKKRSALASPDIRSDAPKDCTHEQTYGLPELEEGAFESELIDNRRENESSYDLQISNTVIARSHDKKA